MYSTFIIICIVFVIIQWHMRDRSSLRRCAPSWEVAGSIHNVVNVIVHWRKPSGRNIALGPTQPQTHMSTRIIACGVKAACAWGWQSYHLHLPIVLKSGSHNFLGPSGNVQTCTGIVLLFCVSVIQSLKKLLCFHSFFLKLLFIGLSESALCDREVTVRALHFFADSERQGTFVSV
jgi:hypothetical protein